jgi:diadenosine tetraphosphatase ApaH/serine/threonine PP2A family protein phosphatase
LNPVVTYTRAVFSDVHANLEALTAVIADMTAREVRSRVCLGDIVGYASQPAECLELTRSLRCPVLLGNHDEAVASEMLLSDMRGSAQSGIQYARERLNAEQRAYLAALPFTRTEPTCEFVHASLDAPSEWTYIHSAWEALQHFEYQTQRLCFCGHTHVPMVWHLEPDGSLSSTRGVGRYALPAEGKVLVNVGSVGQPRDQQPAACYVLYHTHTQEIEFRRVPYDIAEARRKILAADLPAESGNRLLHGR